MPSQSERQRTADVLIQGYLASIIAESRARDDDKASSSSGSSDSGSDGSSVESGSESNSDDQTVAASDAMLRTSGLLYTRRYLADRQPINKSGENLRLLLTDWKYTRPEIFRAHLRLTPECFDLLLTALHMDPVFQNNSNLPQIPVEKQLAIALYRFGHYGNAISTSMVGLWAGIGFGTVRLVTNRVLTAICREEFRRAVIYWPTGADREEAKQWVEDNSCPAWRNGWAMVDGTLIPLYARPGYFGNTWYDRKNNYSLNLQVHFILYGLKNILIIFFINRLSQPLIYGSLITLLVCLAASMMPLPLLKPELHKNIRYSLLMMNGFLPILHILSKTGVKLLIRSM